MCETGFSQWHCEAVPAYTVKTNRRANPGQTPVSMGACRSCLLTAIDEQLRNAESLRDQDMPGTDGITILLLDSSDADASDADDDDEDEDYDDDEDWDDDEDDALTRELMYPHDEAESLNPPWWEYR